jgi:ATP-dependent RNA helicase DHX34
MSATINADLFGSYFNAPVIEVPGRMFPVSIEYLPAEEEDVNLVDPRIVQDRISAPIRQSLATKTVKIKAEPYLRILERIDQTVPSDERGDLLIFVSGMNEIGILSEELQNYANYTRRWIVLNLHSALSIAEQELVFDIAPDGVRKCIISTNIAETSVTIDGIRFIIDSGKVKELGYDTVGGYSRLSEFWISKSSAKQRAGRAGRTGPGECFRFYSEKEYEGLNEFPVPEILRIPLDSILLEIKAFGLGDPMEFDFIERPSEASLKSSLTRLQNVGCLDKIFDITDMGRVLSTLPVDVVIGKMLVLGSISELMSSILTIAAVISVQAPFSRISESQHVIMENRRELHSTHGDPFTLINMYTEWLYVKSEGGGKSRHW